jgi:hypothetical protein
VSTPTSLKLYFPGEYPPYSHAWREIRGVLIARDINTG